MEHCFLGIPAKDLWVEIDSKLEQNITIKILDMSGKLIMQQNSPLINGQNKLHINTSTLSSGAYLLQIDSGEIMSKFNLMIE